MTKLLGVPVLAWAAPCLVLAVMWVFVWPSGQAAEADGFQLAALRWAHPLTWLILAVAAAVAGFGSPGAGRRIALLALPAYGAFVYAVVTTRR